MKTRFAVPMVLASLCACILIASSISPASAAMKRSVNVVNGTTQAIGVTFFLGGMKKAVAEGTVEKFNSKSFSMVDEFVTVKLSYVKGCTGPVTRDVPIGKNITVREGCLIEVN